MIVQVLMGELSKLSERCFPNPCQSRGLRRARTGARGRTFTYPAAQLPARTRPRRCSLALTRTHPHGHTHTHTHTHTHIHTHSGTHTRIVPRARAREHTHNHTCRTHSVTHSHARMHARTHIHTRAHSRTRRVPPSIMAHRRPCTWTPTRWCHKSKVQLLHNRVSLPGVSPFPPTTWSVRLSCGRVQ